MMHDVRVFIGTFLGDANQSYYRGLAATWSRRFPRSLKAVPADTVHVTYAFLPRVDESVLATLSAAVAESALAAGPVEVVLEKPGVLWAGRMPRLVETRIAAGGNEIMRLARSIQTRVETSTPELELSTAKSAHVTLARFRRGTSAAEARRAEGELGGEARRENIAVVSLIESRLTPAGPVYRMVAELPMGHRIT
jgi:2'-5' RNA ligase